jgi:hypothetical protein
MVPPAKLLPLPGMATAAEEVGLTTEDDVADRYDTFMEEEPNTFDSKAPGKLCLNGSCFAQGPCRNETT